ncbi:MAG: MetQ/NlpA family ABC transporter substrate-binding protein [Corynebacterium sp.]|uniref:MetQ/NlpA family ABC transporter substrate-binding protein n=1 Tax=Corynebacterium sp. TaxID=1720 RepID=UPI0026DF390F|nr:MetQ/NlpA family ABC transporter substrate-binding protein [Corynebacterium sp.]MDO5670506.1 MetQ/NlpA family ABC transporter substrate-binding protein [Corynebacterium sp.]
MKFRTLTAVIAASGLLAACADATADSDPDAALGVLAASTPHAEILRWVDEQDDSFELDISTVAGGPEANAAVANGSVPVNFFQHEPYLLDWIDQTGKEGVEVLAQIHIEPISLYSQQYSDIADLPDGARIALPRSASNFARGLLLLQDHGLITLDAELDPAAVSQITVASIAENPHGFEFLPIEDELTSRSLDDPSIAAAVINSNFALEAGYDPAADGLIAESPTDNPYANIVVGAEEFADDPRVVALVDALTSPATSEWIRERYDSAVVPVHGE